MRRRVVYDSLLSFYHIEKTKYVNTFFQMIICSRKLMIRVIGLCKYQSEGLKVSELVTLAIDPVLYLFAFRCSIAYCMYVWIYPKSLKISETFKLKHDQD